MFHRLAAPSYFVAGGGSLPPGYDYINNADAGTPALADTAKSSGPNAGTYFIAFSEDGTSADANRPHAALAENTDILDDYFHRDIAVPKVTADVTTVAPVSSFQLVDTQGIFVGVAGTPNNANGINTFVEILDSNNNEIIGDPATGARSRVTAISGATVGSGFATAGAVVTCTVSPPIPSGVVYRVFYGVRGNLSTLPADALSLVQIRAAQERDAATLDFENQVSRRSGQNVDALVAPIFETPNGVRRPKSASMSFDIDPDDSVGGLRAFHFRRSRDAGATFLAQLLENPSDPSGFTRRFELGAGNVTGFGVAGGTMSFYDGNIAAAGAGATPAALPAHIPLSGALGSDGDSYLRLAERIGSPGAPTRSVLKALNARFYVTCGDGVSTFGDFNGETAVQSALTAFAAFGGVLHIRVKKGTYALTGASGTSIPAGTTLILEGDDRDVCIIEGATTDGQTFNVSGGRLIFYGVQLRLKTLSTQGGIFVTGAGSRVQVIHSKLVQQKLVYTNTTPSALLAATVEPVVSEDPQLFVSDSFLDMDGIVDTTGAYPLLHIRVNDNFEHRDWVIKDSVLRCCDHNSPVKIEAMDNTLTDTRVRNVFFLRCRILLASTTDNGNGYMTGNAGICWLEPLNNNKKLGIDNLVWKDCDVWANHKGTGLSSVLVNLHPAGLKYTGGGSQNGICNLGRIVIDGGDWQQPDVDTIHIAWCVNARHLTVRNIDFRSTSKLTGLSTKDANGYFNGIFSTSTTTFGAMTFLSNVTAETVNPFRASRMWLIENIRIRNVTQAAASAVTNGLADFYVNSPNSASCTLFIKDVVVTQVNTGTPTGGNVPLYRIRINANGGAGQVSDVLWTAHGLSNTNPWVTSYIMRLFGARGTVFSRCRVFGPNNGSISTNNNGVLAYGDPGGGALFEHCCVHHCGTGWTFYNDQSSVCHAVMVGGNFSSNYYGMYVTAVGTNPPDVTVIGAYFFNNNSFGFWANMPSTSWCPGLTSAPAHVSLIGCLFKTNNSGGVGGGDAYIQVRYELTAPQGGGRDVCFGTFIGNVLQHGAADITQGKAQFVGFVIGVGNMKGLQSDSGVTTDGTSSGHNNCFIRIN